VVLIESSWKIKNSKSYPKLTENIEADVVIIGAGITGIFNAYILSCAGLKVVVLEANENILQNTTLFTTAFITKMIDTSFNELVNIFGAKKAELIWRSGQDAILLITDILKREGIDCELKFVPIFTYAKNTQEFAKLIIEYEALKKSGIEAKIKESSKTGSDELGFKNWGFMEISNQAKFHPIKFGVALAEAATTKGAKIFTDSKVVAIIDTNVKTKDYEVRAKDILIATYFPMTNKGTRFRKAMYVSYVYELEIVKNLIPEGLYLDMENPYHYFRIDPSGPSENFDRMIVGGEDHRKDIKISPEKNFNALTEYVESILGNSGYKLIHKWTGDILESVDGLPLVGRISAHTLVATAFGGNGMTYSGISAAIIRDLITGRQNPYANLYDLKRTPTLKQLAVKGFYYAQEFFGGALKNVFGK
jgi:glycine/D-amino acid oxidase-like deaminating enzyme